MEPSEPWLLRIVGQNAYDGKFQISATSNITVRYLEMDGAGCEPNQVCGLEDGFRILHPTNLILEHNWISRLLVLRITGSMPATPTGFRCPAQRE